MSTLELTGFNREYPNDETRDRRYIEAYLFALEAFTRDTPCAEEAYDAIVRLSEILVRRGLLPVAYDRAHTIHLSEPMTEVEFIKLLEDISGAKNSEYIRPCEHRFIPCDSEREYTESDQENCMDISQKYSC